LCRRWSRILVGLIVFSNCKFASLSAYHRCNCERRSFSSKSRSPPCRARYAAAGTSSG
jgi:hypothetical protein